MTDQQLDDLKKVERIQWAKYQADKAVSDSSGDLWVATVRLIHKEEERRKMREELKAEMQVEKAREQ